MTADRPLLAVDAIRKAYGPSVLALDGVGLDVKPGEVHALLGGNGAGKSTLSRVIAGITQPDSGAMTHRGEPFAPANRREAERDGVRMVMQELNLVGTLTIAESIFLNRLPSRFGVIDRRTLHANAVAVLARLGLADLDPARQIGSLGVGQQQLVEIAAALAERCDVLILDEPTAALTSVEVDRLFSHVAALTSEGVAVVYISHRLEEIGRIADRVTVLRDGRVVGTLRSFEATEREIVRLMAGRELRDLPARRGAERGEPALRVEHLKRGDAVRDVSFQAHRGEILGISGLMGSGRTETLRAIFGADLSDSGSVFVGSGDQPAVIRQPRDAVRLGIALVTEDRKAQGLLLSRSIRENVTLARLDDVSRLGVVDWAAERAAADHLAATLDIRASSVEQTADELSGGNQQKVVIGKWLFRDADVLLFDEPTRGIDASAKFEIYGLLLELAADGKAIIVVSSELEELTVICDRIAVMSAGRIVETFEPDEWSVERITAAALSGYGEATS